MVFVSVVCCHTIILLLKLHTCYDIFVKKLELIDLSGEKDNVASILQKQPLEVFFKKCVLKNFANFLFNNAASLERRLQHRCFPVNFTKFLRTPLGHCFCYYISFDCLGSMYLFMLPPPLCSCLPRKENVLVRNRSKILLASLPALVISYFCCKSKQHNETYRQISKCTF